MASSSSQRQQRRNRTSQRGQSETSESRYECSICYDEAKNPVVLKCGHFYCWKCIKEWLSHVQRCPVCNRRTNVQEDVIPIYGKGLSEEEQIPRPKPRPPQQKSNSQGAGGTSSEESDGLDTLFKVGMGLIGGAIIGSLLSSFFSQKSDNKNSSNRH